MADAPTTHAARRTGPTKAARLAGGPARAALRALLAAPALSALLVLLHWGGSRQPAVFVLDALVLGLGLGAMVLPLTLIESAAARRRPTWSRALLASAGVLFLAVALGQLALVQTRYTVVMLDGQGAVLAMTAAQEALEWCWGNGFPIWTAPHVFFLATALAAALATLLRLGGRVEPPASGLHRTWRYALPAAAFGGLYLLGRTTTVDANGNVYIGAESFLAPTWFLGCLAALLAAAAVADELARGRHAAKRRRARS